MAEPVRPVLPTDQKIMLAGLAMALVFLAVALVLPLGFLLVRAFQDAQGGFVGLANVTRYLSTPSLAASVVNSLWTAALVTLVVVPLAFTYAYALTRSCIPLRLLFRAVMLLPVLAPSLLPALSLVYLFGNQGFLRGALMGAPLQGPVGIVLAQCVACFPHAAMILAVALSAADARLFEAAASLRAGRWRILATVTLPGARGGLASAAVVVFTLVVTDFGIPKVIGGNFPVLATEVYKQVVGQQNFNMGAVVGLILLLPALAAYGFDRWANAAQESVFSGRAVPYAPRPRTGRDLPLFVFCCAIAGLLLAVVGMAVWGSFIQFWPWNLALTLDNYDFGRFDPAGWSSLENSLVFAALTAGLGTGVIFLVAWLLERGPRLPALSGPLRFLAAVPLAVPGLVLGLAYILFFNAPWNPLGVMYGTLGILVLNSLVHFYTVCHLTAVTAIRQLDPEFESVSASLGVPVWVTFWRVTLPICLPAILEIAAYLFMSAMTTVSAVIFLYGPDTKPASVAVVHMDETGQVSAAAAMAVVLLGLNLTVKLAQLGLGAALGQGMQRWRRR